MQKNDRLEQFLRQIQFRIHAWATAQHVLVLGLLLLLLGLLVLPAAWSDLMRLSGGVPALDSLWYYNTQTGREHLQAYGRDGRQLYLFIELTVNLIFPIVYTLFSLLMVSWLSQKRRAGVPNWLVLLLLLPFCFDLLESAGIIWMLLSYPETGYIPLMLSGVMNALKWLSGLAACAGVLWHLSGIFTLFYPF